LSSRKKGGEKTTWTKVKGAEKRGNLYKVSTSYLGRSKGITFRSRNCRKQVLCMGHLNYGYTSITSPKREEKTPIFLRGGESGQ